MNSTKFIIFVIFGLCCILTSTDGRYHGFGGGNRFGDLTKEQRQELKELKQTLRSGNATKQQTQDSLQTFFEGVGGDALTHYNEKQAKKEAHKIQFNNFTSNANISDSTKNLLTQVQAVKDNMQITKAEEKKQIKALFEEASDAVKQELKSLHPHGNHRGGFGGHGQRFGGRHNHGGQRPQPAIPATNEDVQ